ncbi:hypothetical protein KUCAC02_035392, partial [Chaenocephalus aceratus]
TCDSLFRGHVAPHSGQRRYCRPSHPLLRRVKMLRMKTLTLPEAWPQEPDCSRLQAESRGDHLRVQDWKGAGLITASPLGHLYTHSSSHCFTVQLDSHGKGLIDMNRSQNKGIEDHVNKDKRDDYEKICSRHTLLQFGHQTSNTTRQIVSDAHSVAYQGCSLWR